MPAALGANPNLKTPAEEVIHAATHPVRWAILERLKGNMSAGEVAEALELRPANVQYHLKELAKLGLVDEFPRPDNKRAFVYARRILKGHVQLTPKGLSAVVHYE